VEIALWRNILINYWGKCHISCIFETIKKNGMNKISIANIGPIKEANLDLNKINVFIGPQSSGKSTIAKTISYCQWVEKRYILDGKFEENFLETFMEFHRIDANFFSDDSSIKYETENIYIEFTGCKSDKPPVLTKKNEGTKYQKSKNIYIPAERNFIFAIDNIGKYKRVNDNIMNFIYDWSEMRKDYLQEHQLSALNLGIDYYYQLDSNKDMLHLEGNGKDIELGHASSGLQSLIPLLLPLEYMTSDKFFRNPVTESVDEKEEFNRIANTGFFKDRAADEMLDEFCKTKIRRLFYQSSQFVIEEPEQNLFPETQRDLIYYLLEKISGERDHKLLITTHSPYILYALNNCMMAGLVYDKMDKESMANIKCDKSRISPSKVKVYEIRDGKVECIQQEDGLIGENYLDQKMKEIMDDYYLMLNYYQ
jgi:hypothetical protein